MSVGAKTLSNWKAAEDVDVGSFSVYDKSIVAVVWVRVVQVVTPLLDNSEEFWGRNLHVTWTDISKGGGVV